MANSFMAWLSEILASFDGSDFFAFFAGCLAMVLWKNVRGMSIFKDGDGKRHIKLPKFDRRWLIWAVVLVSMVGIMWSTNETARSQDRQAQQMYSLAIRLCEGSKVTRVEAKASQDLFFAALNMPPEIAKLDPNDPVRKQWGQEIGLRYLGTLDDAAQQRDALQMGQSIDPDFWERYFGPDRPEPICKL